MPIFDMCVPPDLDENLHEASLSDHNWYPVEKSVCTQRFEISVGSLIKVIMQRLQMTTATVYHYANVRRVGFHND